MVCLYLWSEEHKFMRKGSCISWYGYSFCARRYKEIQGKIRKYMEIKGDTTGDTRTYNWRYKEIKCEIQGNTRHQTPPSVSLSLPCISPPQGAAKVRTIQHISLYFIVFQWKFLYFTVCCCSTGWKHSNCISVTSMYVGYLNFFSNLSIFRIIW